MADDTIREYNMEDSEMLELANMFHTNFETDKTDFTTLFPDMADPFAADFMTAIDTAETAVPGWQVDAEIASVTANLNEAMRAGQKALQVLFIYVERTWDDDNKLREFGKAKYKADRAVQAKLPNLMRQAHAKAIETANAAALAAKGYTAAMATDLVTKAQAIEDLNNEQEILLNARTNKTAIRVGKYNAVWDFMRNINQASKVVFADDQTKLDMYRLYPTSSQSLPKPQGLNMAPDPQDPNIAVLTWDPVAGATDYRVFYSEMALGQPSNNFAEIGTSQGATIFNAPIMPNRENYWKIKATNGIIGSAFSDEVAWTG